MRHPPLRSLLLLAIASAVGGCAATAGPGPSSEAARSAALPTISARTAAMESRAGFVPLHYETATGRIFLEVVAPDRDFLYLNTLAAGLGSNSPLLDRGQTGREAVVRFERRGPRVLLVERNLSYRALSDDEALRRSVEESFPSSVLASMPVEAAEGDRILVDATEFLLSDVYDVRGRARGAGVGELRVDRNASFIALEHTKAFPLNSEIRAVLTYASDAPGFELRRLAPDARWVTLQQHHSFVALPETPMALRRFDPRAGMFAVAFLDFARGFDRDYRDGWVVRWRLEKQDPSAALSEPVKPIVYYLDPAVPEPYRTAFIEGGLWWDRVFEAAGFRDAFRIEPLPEGADPMDARYSVIQWVHRREPGPSVGPSYVDPRTGEILKTNIRMDSHRSLVDYNIYAGLLPAAGADGLALSAEQFAMARRRQHSAHEIGHTLGVAHNFIAASQGRASVMDYPFPLIELDAEGRIDVSRAYREGPGAHDTLAIRYAYTPFANPAAEEAGLRRIVEEGIGAGLRFITGGHASQSGSIPEATQWIEGSDMLQALERARAVRGVLLEAFDERAIRPGEPMALLNQRLAHVYLHHRYALEGAVKYVGGMQYSYALRGDGQRPTRIVPASEQRRALGMVLQALEPAEMEVPERAVALIPPPPFGSDGSERWIGSPAGPALDPVGMAASLASEIVDNLLHRERAARLVSFHARDAANPSLAEVLTRVVDATWGERATSDAEVAYRNVSQRAVLDALLDLGGDARATSDVRAAAEQQLAALAIRLGGRTTDVGQAASVAARGGRSDAESAHRARAVRDIARYFAGEDDPSQRSRPARIPLPWP